jgi:ABC-type antimicrobial peptide transport system permease subunit
MFLGGIALLLAAMGVYAVIAYGVAQRTQEFGVRMALGAHPADLLGQVLRRGLALALIGSAVGLAAAFGTTRLLSGFLYGVSPFDLVIFTAVPAALVGVALIACYLPALRATRVNPIEALRAE